jgi:hypothetical protein
LFHDADELMQDLKIRLEKLLAAAADCDLIGNHATDIRKRATFRQLAEEFRTMAQRLREQIAEREAIDGTYENYVPIMASGIPSAARRSRLTERTSSPRREGNASNTAEQATRSSQPLKPSRS